MATDSNFDEEIQTLEEYPERWPTRKRLVERMLDGGQGTRAAEVVWRAPSIPQEPHELAWAMMVLGGNMPRRAVRLVHAVLEQHHDNAPFLVRCADALEQLGLGLQAVRFYAVAQAVSPELTDAEFEAGMLALDASGSVAAGVAGKGEVIGVLNWVPGGGKGHEKDGPTPKIESVEGDGESAQADGDGQGGQYGNPSSEAEAGKDGAEKQAGDQDGQDGQDVDEGRAQPAPPAAPKPPSAPKSPSTDEEAEKAENGVASSGAGKSPARGPIQPKAAAPPTKNEGMSQPDLPGANEGGAEEAGSNAGAVPKPPSAPGGGPPRPPSKAPAAKGDSQAVAKSPAGAGGGSKPVSLKRPTGSGDRPKIKLMKKPGAQGDAGD